MFLRMATPSPVSNTSNAQWHRARLRDRFEPHFTQREGRFIRIFIGRQGVLLETLRYGFGNALAKARARRLER